MMLQRLKNCPPFLLMFLLISLPHLAYALYYWHSFPLHEGMPIGQTDPDSWLRLTLVREWLTSGNWYSHAVPHTNFPLGGISSPWTRPLDVVIAALTQLQPESVELNLRLLRASLLLPWLWMSLLTLGIYRIIRLHTPIASAYVMAGTLITCLPPLWNYFTLGNADHHAPLAAMFIWVLGTLVQPSPSRRSVLISGLLLGLMLWVSIEAILLIGLMYIWYGIAWLRGDRLSSAPLLPLAISTAVTVTLAMMIERAPTQWLTPLYDSISIVHSVAVIIAALIATCLHYCRPSSASLRLGIAVLTVGPALAILHRIYPDLFAGPLVGSNPYIFSHFMPTIKEAQPFYKVDITQLLATIFIPILAITLCVVNIRQPTRRFHAPHYAAPCLFFLVATTALYCLEQRWSYYLLPLSIAAIAPLMGALFTPDHLLISGRWPASRILNLSETDRVKIRLPIAIAIIATPLLLMMTSDIRTTLHKQFVQTTPQPNALSPAEQKEIAKKQRDYCHQGVHQLLYSGALRTIAGNPSATVLASTDFGAEILFWTNHRIIASNYHREGTGIRYVWEAEKITDIAELRRYLAVRRIDALLLCPEPQMVKGSLWQALAYGTQPPHWLTRIPYSLPARKEESPPIEAQFKINPVLLVVKHHTPQQIE